jgi:lysine 2,3-aminomutase
MLAQTVLLKGVNDNASVLAELFRFLSQEFIRPYYLHHPDKTKGAMHFHLSYEEGKKHYNALRKLLPGWCIPHYITESAQGQGKYLASNAY